MNRKKLTIIISLCTLIALLLFYILNIQFSTSRTIEIDANGGVKVTYNHNNEIIKTVALNSEGQRILDNLDKEQLTKSDIIKNVLFTANSLNYIGADDTVKVLFVSKDLEKDTQYIKDLSTELELSITEIPLTNQIIQYKLTEKDYKVINKVKANTPYSSFKIIDEGFVSKESTPYITNITYKSDSFFLTFSKNVLFDGSEQVTCYKGAQTYETTPAGYNKNTLAVFVKNNPTNATLYFDVKLKDYPDVTMFGSAIASGNLDNSEVEVTFSIDADVNRKKLDDLKTQIDNADIAEEDKTELNKQYDILNESVDKIASEDDLKDFNTMYDNLSNSLKTLTEASKEDSIEKTTDETKTEENKTQDTPKQEPVVEQTPKEETPKTEQPQAEEPKSPKTQAELKALNDKHYNTLNGYKAVVLSIQNQEQRNTLNAEINKLYYELSIAKTEADYATFESHLQTFVSHLSPYL